MQKPGRKHVFAARGSRRAQKLEDRAVAEQVEILGIWVGWIAETVACLSGAAPAIVQARQPSFVVGDGPLLAVPAVGDALVVDQQRDKQDDGDGKQPEIPPGQECTGHGDRQPIVSDNPERPFVCGYSLFSRCKALFVFGAQTIRVTAGEFRRITCMKPQSLILLLLSAGSFAHAQMVDNTQPQMTCRDHSNGENASHCEIKETTIAASSRLTVDGNKNGGVSVRGWSQNQILVRAQIQTNAPTDAEAAGMVSQIVVSTTGGQIQASGPDFGSNHGWAVSYEIFVPHQTDLSVTAHNGGVSITDIRGNVQFDTVNGGVSLKRLAGTVHGETKNGGVNIELMGDRWDGGELNAKTTNGGVSLKVPANYNARFEASTVNGGISMDFPVVVNGKIGRDLATNIGAGGSLIHVTTTNGGVSVKRI
jgi:hypothetical protein